MSKEEIEKAKGRCNSIVEFCENNKICKENNFCSDCYIEIKDIKAIKTLLQYIDQLEADNYESNKILNEYIEDREKQNKIIDLMAEQFVGAIWDIEEDDSLILKDKEEVKQYFEKKVEEK